MKKIIPFILIITFLNISLNAGNLLRDNNDTSVLPYISFNKLNEKIYSPENKDTSLGIGIDVSTNKNTNFVIAFEGDIYNEDTNNLSIAPAKKVGLYLNGGAVTYKFKYRF